VPQVGATPEQVAGGAQRGGRAISLGEHAAAQPGGNLGRIDFVMLGLAARDGWQREGVAQDQGNAWLSA
jgi:hypothetical protein